MQCNHYPGTLLWVVGGEYAAGGHLEHGRRGIRHPSAELAVAGQVDLASCLVQGLRTHRILSDELGTFSCTSYTRAGRWHGDEAKYPEIKDSMLSQWMTSQIISAQRRARKTELMKVSRIE